MGNDNKYCYDPIWNYYDYFYCFYIQSTVDEKAIEQLNEIAGHVGTAETGYPYGEGKFLSAWYDYSHCFVSYLIENYGLDKVKNLILNGESEASYEEILGISFENVKSEWLDFIYNYETEKSTEDVINYEKEMLGY